MIKKLEVHWSINISLPVLMKGCVNIKSIIKWRLRIISKIKQVVVVVKVFTLNLPKIIKLPDSSQRCQMNTIWWKPN